MSPPPPEANPFHAPDLEDFEEQESCRSEDAQEAASGVRII
jgi:hypothetical protein